MKTKDLKFNATAAIVVAMCMNMNATTVNAEELAAAHAAVEDMADEYDVLVVL